MKEREFTARRMGCQPGHDHGAAATWVSTQQPSTFLKFFRWLKQSPSPTTDEGDDSVDPDNPFPEPITIEISDVFDLHSVQPRDVKAVVEEYLYQAHEKGFRSVRIIHGKGIGVQREMVRSILARTPFVFDWTDAPSGGGGWGATVVRFK